MSRPLFIYIISSLALFAAGCARTGTAQPDDSQRPATPQRSAERLSAEGNKPDDAPPTTPPNTQPELIPLLTPSQALASVVAPKGFLVTQFASEPDVQQPIAMTTDSRGRLWVAECFTYAENGEFDTKLRDRIVVLEDTDADGHADKRTVFWDDLQMLTSVEVGFGGVWALCTPHLLFIPDRDGDDRPDGEPIVMLDGWQLCGHTLVNGLRWGPDGWLYGRHGIQGTSHVGRPGADDSERTAVTCGIWRYHPQRHEFEVVCHGTTNPWGMDWNDHGQLFFINTVIGHLWHALPGAHFRRMYGEDLQPDLYELIDQTADHVHWDDGKEDWTAQRKGVSGGTDRAGGGHAHTGLMFYLGDNWPSEYRDELFTLNLHGRRINQDHVERHGATYVGRHRPDLIRWGDEWFRGLDLIYGHDGGVYVLDWSDIGECHEADGLHRTSGRVYKIRWSDDDPATQHEPSPLQDVARRSNDELVKLQMHRNDWYVRRARLTLHERFVRGDDMTSVRQSLETILDSQSDVTRQLRALWCLHVTGSVSNERLTSLLAHDNEHLRVWAIQLLVEDKQLDPSQRQALLELAELDESGLVLAYLASALQRLPAQDRMMLAEKLSVRAEFASDRVLPLMVWYGIESLVPGDIETSIRLVSQTQMPQVARHVARRITSQIDEQPAGVAELTRLLVTQQDAKRQTAILAGMADALRGWDAANAPEGWTQFVANYQAMEEPMRSLARELSIVFREGVEVADVLAFIADDDQPAESRRQAIRSLVAAKTDDAEPLGDLLVRLLSDARVVEEAVRGLAVIDLPRFAPLLLDQYAQIDGSGKDAIVEVLATRVDSATLLLDGVEKQIVPHTEIDNYLLRQLQMFADEAIIARVRRIWPEQQLMDEDKLRKVQRYVTLLTDEFLSSADLEQGQQVYQRTCGQCHKLFGEGGEIGPELTGAQRHSLAYWLENSLDPSAVIPDQYRMSVVELTDGRLLSGLVRETNSRTLTLQTPTQMLVLQRHDIQSVEPSRLSLMPDGQLDALTETEVRDLVGYLMSQH
jgi:putative membrane-bound dehydrogenase-like protein